MSAIRSLAILTTALIQIATAIGEECASEPVAPQLGPLTDSQAVGQSIMNPDAWKHEVERVIHPATLGGTLGEILDAGSDLQMQGSGMVPWGVHSYRWGKRVAIGPSSRCIMTLSLIEESTGERQLISYSDADVVLDGMVDSIWIGAESWRALSGEDFDLSLVDFPSSVREWKGKFRWLSKSDLHGTLSVCENGLFFYHQKIPFPTSDAECIEKWLKDLPERQADKEALSVPAYIGIIDVNLFRQFRESTPKEPSE